jgi:hypothetical protein
LFLAPPSPHLTASSPSPILSIPPFPARPTPPARRPPAFLGTATAAAAAAAALLLTASPAAIAASIPDPGCELRTVPASGLQWCDTKEGAGPPAKASAPVRAHYTGRLASNGVVFDSSFERGRPLTFSKNQVIKGWGLGVFGDDGGDGAGGGGGGSAIIPPMKEGGVRRLVIPPELGYGQRGAGGVIPPGAALVFDVTLLGPRTR